jgi:hypothetical protein
MHLIRTKLILNATITLGLSDAHSLTKKIQSTFAQVVHNNICICCELLLKTFYFCVLNLATIFNCCYFPKPRETDVVLKLKIVLLLSIKMT